MARSRRYPSKISRRHIPMYSLGWRVSPISTSTLVGEISFIRRTLRSTVVSGKSNSPIIQSGIAPPHGLALSIFLSNKTVSIPFSWAKISAAQAPDGPPPITATLYFISSDDDVEAALCATPPLMKDEGVNAAAELTRRDATVSFMINVYYCGYRRKIVMDMCRNGMLN